MKTKRALLVIDAQNDFMPGGSLAVKDGDEIVPVINKLTKSDKYDLVVFTKDWHPANHKSFASQHNGKDVFSMTIINGMTQVLWPDHCVQDTLGAEFHQDIDFDIPNLYIFKKGMNPEIDSYSGFLENDLKTSTGLSEFLKKREITEVDIVGLALDYCVCYTAVDSYKSGFKTTVLMNGVKSISDDLMPTLKIFEKEGVDIKYGGE